MGSRIEAASAEIVRVVRAHPFRVRPWGLAVAVVDGGEVSIALDQAGDPLTERSLFQIGSVTKTMTGLLLAQAVVGGGVELLATVGSILGDAAGNAKSVTLLELATQRSGLPRLPPNLEPEDPSNPYANYTEADLLAALQMVERAEPGRYEYSNFGFMLLGLLLERIAGRSYAELVTTDVFEPLELCDAICGVPEHGDFVPGYRGAETVPWWQLQLPGPGGVAASITDLASYVRAFVDPPGLLREAIDLCIAEHTAAPPAMGLGWVLQGGGHWHNGGTGGFRSFVAFHARSQTGVAVLANTHDAEMIDGVGFRVLTELAR
jgi:CubicO group peptidase (beta-lactamase class C family)